MARKIQVVLEDDLTGGSADETVTFALDGVALRDRPEHHERQETPRFAEPVRRRRAPRRRRARRGAAPKRGGSGEAAKSGHGPKPTGSR